MNFVLSINCKKLQFPFVRYECVFSISAIGWSTGIVNQMLILATCSLLCFRVAHKFNDCQFEVIKRSDCVLKVELSSTQVNQSQPNQLNCFDVHFVIKVDYAIYLGNFEALNIMIIAHKHQHCYHQPDSGDIVLTYLFGLLLIYLFVIFLASFESFTLFIADGAISKQSVEIIYSIRKQFVLNGNVANSK